ncbi:hypothetical protein A6456_37870 [Paraburkholderia tropica]|nr:hypothetical protein A6456_37870 [Paraburkholderia tropica]
MPDGRGMHIALAADGWRVAYLDTDGARHIGDSADVNPYLQEEITGADFTANDYRTWMGSVFALASLRKLEWATMAEVAWQTHTALHDSGYARIAHSDVVLNAAVASQHADRLKTRSHAAWAASSVRMSDFRAHIPRLALLSPNLPTIAQSPCRKGG